MKKHLFIILLLTAGVIPFSVFAQSITLVDFGASASGNSFGLAGWSTVLKSSNLNYTSLGNGGLIAASEVGEYDDYRGIRGTAREFLPGERIIVTWYNNSDETFLFTSRISFTDDDNPDDSDPGEKWFTMRSFDDYRETYSEILPHSYARTVFNISEHGVHKSDGPYSLVNINLNIEWYSTYQKRFLVCDKIELFSDADIAPPSQPTGLSATVLSDSKISLTWNAAADNVDVVEYLIYLDGEIEGYSRSNNYTCVYLAPNKSYIFSVTAFDAAGNESVKSSEVSASTLAFNGSDELINPGGFEYLGAITLPEEFNWGGEAITHNQDGDGGQTGPADGFPGSMFVTNLNQPENGLVGEITIPTPVISQQKNVEDLNQAVIITQPVNIRPVNVNNWDYVDIWRTGLEYLPQEQRLYSSWSIHYTVTGEKHASISCCDASNLAGSTKYGAWYIGNAAQPPIDAMMSDWLFSVPQSWADANSNGRNLVVGRCRDGGLSGLGPTMYAFAKAGATPPAANSELPFTTMLQYGSVEGTDNYHFPNSVDGYNHSDDWREAVWLTADNQNAVAIIGNKALGHNWYGYNGEWMRHDWVIADVPYPEFYETDPDGKGWRAHNRQPMIIFYDPADFANVATGHMNSYDPQPYSAIRIDKDLFWGKDHEIFSATYDSQNRILYVTEFVREPEGNLLLHAWRVDPLTIAVETETPAPIGFKLHQNYPNPFNPTTIINYRLAMSSDVNLSIYNTTGQLVRTLVDEYQPAGSKSVDWNGLNDGGKKVASGVYIYQLKTGNVTQCKKMILVQ